LGRRSFCDRTAFTARARQRAATKPPALKAIREALRTAKRVWLATDCDREGRPLALQHRNLMAKGNEFECSEALPRRFERTAESS
jgi:DNA topoisomerase IA